MDLVWISLCSATDLHVHALCLHVGDGAVGDKLAETKVERSESLWGVVARGVGGRWG